MKNLGIKFILLYLFSFFSYCIGFTQEKWKIADVQVSYMDNLGQYYFLTNNNSTLIKTDKNGEIIATKESKLLGTIASIDCKHPFKIKVFYPKQGKIQIVDNTFAVLQEIDLRKNIHWNIVDFATTKEDFIILLDIDSQQWIKVDEYGNGEPYGIPFDFLDIDWSDFLAFQIKDNIWSLLFKNEVLLFDNYGGYKSKIPLEIEGSTKIDAPYFYTYDKGTWIQENLKDFSRKSIDLSIEGSFEGWSVHKNQVILHFQEYVEIHKF